MVEKILVREYLTSLKEDGELDRIFVFLLEAMGFEIITTPVHSKGQSQYGKDVVAVGTVSGVKYCWTFELKGYSDKDVNSVTFNKDDGIRTSLQESKDVAYKNKGFPDFDKLPIKVVLVHNGIVVENMRLQFNSFIEKNFEEGEFEDWDIYRLTDLFYEKLFCEYLFSDNTNTFSFKRLLMFLDVPDYDFQDLVVLLSKITEEYKANLQNDRQRKKYFSSLNLLMMVIWNYAQQKNNLNPAKYCIDFLILNTWSFLLTQKVQKSKKLQRHFDALLNTQMKFYKEYLDKTASVALFKNGLFMPSGVGFESIGYPLRAFEYMDFLIYTYELNNVFVDDEAQMMLYQKNQKEQLKQFINSNREAICKPILDNHFIPIFHLVDFFLVSRERTKEDVDFIGDYIVNCIEEIALRNSVKKVFPYCGHDLDHLVLLESTNTKHGNYPDSSSLLITYLLELLAIFSCEPIYIAYKDFFEKELSLQTAIPDFEKFPDFEIRFFKGHLHNEYNIEFKVDLPKNIKEFRQQLIDKKHNTPDFVSKQLGYSFLITLAQSFYKNEPFPHDWRVWLKN